MLSSPVGHLQVHARELVLQPGAWILEAILERVDRDVDDIVHVGGRAAVATRVLGELFREHADHFEPGPVDFDELAKSGSVPEQAHLRRFSQHGHGGARLVGHAIEKAAFREPQAVDLAVGRLHAVDLRRIL